MRSVEFQTGPRTVVGVHYVHNNLGRTIEDFGALVDGDTVYSIGNPGEGRATTYPPSFSDRTATFPMPKPKRQYDALELTLNRRFANNWFAGASYTLSRLYGNYSGLANSDEISTPTTGVSSSDGTAVGRQHRASRQQRAHRLGHRHHPVGLQAAISIRRAASPPIVRTS